MKNKASNIERWRIARLTERALREAVVKHTREGWCPVGVVRQPGSGDARVWVQDLMRFEATAPSCA